MVELDEMWLPPAPGPKSENGLAVMQILADIAKDPLRGVLVVTHDPRVMRFADRIIHIEDGRICGEENNGRGKCSGVAVTQPMRLASWQDA